MRAILVDWLVDVSVHFEVMSESLHFAVSYIDRTLSKIQVEKTKLQLVGVACMKIADVFNEKSKEYYRQENSLEYSYITADEYTPSEVVAMEKQILNILNFDLYSPPSVAFIKVYNKVLEVDPKTLVCSLYLSDLMLLAPNTHHYSASLIASSCIFIAICSTRPDLL
jgi:cyclin A